MLLPTWTPLAVLGVGALTLYLTARWVSRNNALLAVIATVAHILGLLCTWQLWRQALVSGPVQWVPHGAEHAMLSAEPGGLLVALIAQALGALVSVYSGHYLAQDHRYEDYYPLLLGLVAGAFGLVIAADLFVLYLFAGLAGVASYSLVAFRRQTSGAVEAGYKFAITGGMATILMLAGTGYLLRAGNGLALTRPVQALDTWSQMGIGLLLAGLGIKAALVPAHAWLPDAQTHAPSSIAALLSGIMEPAHLYVFIKTGLILGWSRELVGAVLIAAAVMGMLLGNLMALRQTSGRRMLAYSTIAQIGYILLAFGIGLHYGRVQVLVAAFFLLAAHALLKALAFLAEGICHSTYGATRLNQLDGLYHRMPVTGAAFGAGLLGLAGFPPLALFVAKSYLFVGMPAWTPVATVLSLLYMGNSLLSLGYYLPPVFRFFKQSPSEDRMSVSLWMLSPLVLLLTGALILGLFPGPLARLANQAALSMLAWGG